MKRLFAHPSFHQSISNKITSWSLLDARRMASKTSTQSIEVNEKKSLCGHRWQIHEHLVLIDAMEKQEKELAQAGKEGLQKTSKERWENIAAYCHHNGINRTAPQCRDKWHRLMVAFSKVKNWESFRTPGKKSFWKMKVEERNAEGLCFRLDEQTFAALDAMDHSTIAPTLVSESIIEQEAKSVYDQSIVSGKSAQHDIQQKDSSFKSTEASRNVQHGSGVHIGNLGFEDCIIKKKLVYNVHQISNNTVFTPREEQGTTCDGHIGLLHEDHLINMNSSNVHQTSNKLDAINRQTYLQEEGITGDDQIGQPVHEDIVINKITPSNLHQSSNTIGTCNPQFNLEGNCDLHNTELGVAEHSQSNNNGRDVMLQCDQGIYEVGLEGSGIDHKGISVSATIQDTNDGLHDDRPPLIVSLISKCLTELKEID